MKTSMTKVSAALALMALSGVAMAGISTTRHNLGSTNGGGNHVVGAGATTEICVFCHTPHGSDATNTVAPLWNRAMSTSSAFTTYATLGTGTLDGKEAGIGSISIACLSCHDGTQAIDVVLNAPGFGGKSSSNGINGTGGWTDANQMNLFPLSAEIVYLSTDLRNDHPISIQYGGGNITTAALAVATKDTDFVTPQNMLTTGGSRIWWIETSGSPATKEKTDLPLYSRTLDAISQPFVECGSCHDPHINNTTFLRPAVGNAGSAVCLACHVK